MAPRDRRTPGALISDETTEIRIARLEERMEATQRVVQGRMDAMQRMMQELRDRQDKIADDSNKQHMKILERLGESRAAEERIERKAVTRPQLLGLLPVGLALFAAVFLGGAILGQDVVREILDLPAVGGAHGAP